MNYENFWKYFNISIKIFGGMLVFFVLLFFSISMGWLGELPSIEEIKNPKKAISTQIISEDLELLGKYYYENRTELSYSNIPKHTIDALIATEDSRFYEHSGIDAWGMTTAVFRTFLLGKKSGASTITQQLAKNLFHNSERANIFTRLFQKAKEWFIAVELESNFSKQEIIALYLNTVPFLHNSFGIKEATKTYFNKEVKDLKVEESAVLIGMLKGPGLYNPKTNPENAINRRNIVLSQMLKETYLSQKDYDKLIKTPLKIDYHLTSHNTGPAPYLREQIRIELEDLLSDEAKADGSPYNIYTDGLKIFTTINSSMQQYAEEAMEEHMPYLQNAFNREWKGREPYKFGAKANPNLILDAVKETSYYKSLKDNGLDHDEIMKELEKKQSMRIFTWYGERDTLMSVIDSIKYYKKILQVGLCAIDPTNGKIKAWVGGVNFGHFKLDHVRTSTKRQVGSTIKPFLYAVALENGATPCTEIPYEKPLIPGFESWDPKGSKFFKDGEFVKLKDGLQVSDNRIAAQLIKKYGIGNLIDMARNLGAKGEFEEVPSIALGTTDLAVIDMVGAYTPFMNKGIYSKPYYIDRIEDANGHVIYQSKRESREVLGERTSQLMNLMMQNITTGNGTASRLRGQYGLKMEIAGKTGTTQSNSDGWFIGSTPSLLCAVWVGADDPSITFSSTSLGQGASSALPIWAKFVHKSYSNSSLKLNNRKSFMSESDSAYIKEFNCLDLIPASDSTIVDEQETD
jgi:penicillin-binding protein 1A